MSFSLVSITLVQVCGGCGSEWLLHIPGFQEGVHYLLCGLRGDTDNHGKLHASRIFLHLRHASETLSRSASQHTPHSPEGDSVALPGEFAQLAGIAAGDPETVQFSHAELGLVQRSACAEADSRTLLIASFSRSSCRTASWFRGITTPAARSLRTIYTGNGRHSSWIPRSPA